MGQNTFDSGGTCATLHNCNYEISGKSQAGCGEISGIQANLMSLLHYDDRFYNKIL